MEPRSLNLELLIKLLKMTTSAVDGEALTAMRKANDQLKKCGGDWELLLRGKVTLVADPFMSVASPQKGNGDIYSERTRSAPPRPTPTPPPPSGGWGAAATNFGAAPRPQRPPPPPPPPQSPPKATRRNAFTGHCFMCGQFVDAQKGWIFQQPNKNRWEVLCDRDATSTRPIPSRRAPIQKASTHDIFNNI